MEDERIKEIVTTLLDNAFDYLEKSAKEFDSDPKYSVINFFSSVELFLKARLACEHWSLIVADEIVLSKFLDGDSKTLYYEELVKRLNQIFHKEQISKAANEAFNALRKERNKLMHFTHDLISKNPQKFEKLKIDIAIKELLAWHYLKAILWRWAKLFGEDIVVNGINKYESNIKKLEKYYDLKFKAVENILNDYKSQKRIIRKCPICGKVSAVIETFEDYPFTCYECFVCGHIDERREVRITCPACGTNHRKNLDDFNFGSSFKCDCGEVITLEQIIEAVFNTIDEKHIEAFFDTEVITKDNMYDSHIINCTNCDSYDTGVKCNDFYVCTACGAIDKNPPICEYCNCASIGSDFNGIDTFNEGCDFCDGNWENVLNKNN